MVHMKIIYTPNDQGSIIDVLIDAHKTTLTILETLYHASTRWTFAKAPPQVFEETYQACGGGGLQTTHVVDEREIYMMKVLV